MTILVTGGTGLVGPRLLKRVTEAGIECRALVRPGKELPDGVERAEGDILSPESLPAAVEGVTAVIHLAAVFRTRDDRQIWTVSYPRPSATPTALPRNRSPTLGRDKWM
jgi:UDP-glucose 4-epimerase